MKKKSIISLLICCMTLGMVNTSCQDMLTPDSERHAYTVAQDTLYSYWGVLKSLQNIAERYVILNECRADLVDGTSYVSDTIAAIINFGKNGYEEKFKDGQCTYLKVSDYYHVINSCNAYIARCDTARKVSTGQQRSYMLQEYAQVAAIRAWVYMQLVYAYGKVPFYTEPMLTTDSINNFIKDPNHATADAKTLADLLAPGLEEVYNKLDPQNMYPQYNAYLGVCHSMRAMFPLEVVLGDLYLMQAGENDATTAGKAASFYYKFLNSKYGGPLETNKYICNANLVAGMDEPQYNWFGNPYDEPKHELTNGRYRQEAITCIPCNIGRLDGKVYTDICRLFGFEATLLASGSGDEAVSAIGLNYRTNGYRRELTPSRGYEALCDSQKFEYYIGSGSLTTLAFQELDTLPGVGDARRAWIYRNMGSRSIPLSEQYTLPVGDNTLFGKLVSKQCPDGIFSQAYPVIYRKSTIWLRYAEAINRAGFPSYAFAILKNGLINHNLWFPGLTTENKVIKYTDQTDPNYVNPDYDILDTIYYYNAPVKDNKTLRWGSNEENVEINKKEDLLAYVLNKYQEYAAEVNATLGDGEEPFVAPTTVEELKDEYIEFQAKTYSNCPSDLCGKALWYLDRRELKDAASRSWMSFLDHTYLKGYNTTINVLFKKNRYDALYYTADGENVGASKEPLTIGVHQRGCGVLRPEDPYTGADSRKSSFNYVDLVTKKIRENHGVTVTKEQIYGDDPNNVIDKNWIIEAVEDLIIDEDALELAFEGCRFSDLARVAIRRGDNSFLAKRVAKRSGTMNTNLYNILLNSSNWYLPFPTE